MQVFFHKGISLLRISWPSLVFLCCLPFLVYFVILRHYSREVYRDQNNLPPTRVALVLGAAVHKDGTPSSILADRVKAAVDLYKTEKVQKILMSGDNRFHDYNEPDAMRRMAMDLGVPKEDIQVDYAGRRTYDSCWRAKHIFSQAKVTIVTQSFHITRALFLCDMLGVESVGYVADQPHYTAWQWGYWRLRDIFSMSVSLFNVFVKDPPVVKGDKIEVWELQALHFRLDKLINVPV